MAYIKYKEIAKYFNFSKSLSVEELPRYVKDYVFDDEKILIGYKTLRDHGIFTDHKILLFDKKFTFDNTKEIFTIPYHTVSSVSIVFKPISAEMSLFLESGYPLRIKFVRMNDIDKMRLRILYNIIQKKITNQNITKSELDKLVSSEFDF